MFVWRRAYFCFFSFENFAHGPKEHHDLDRKYDIGIWEIRGKSKEWDTRRMDEQNDGERDGEKIQMDYVRQRIWECKQARMATISIGFFDWCFVCVKLHLCHRTKWFQIECDAVGNAADVNVRMWHKRSPFCTKSMPPLYTSTHRSCLRFAMRKCQTNKPTDWTCVYSYGGDAEREKVRYYGINDFWCTSTKLANC